jgi:hypothetical protein
MKHSVETREEIRRMIEREWREFRQAHPELELRDDRILATTGAMRRRGERLRIHASLASLAPA